MNFIDDDVRKYIEDFNSGSSGKNEEFDSSLDELRLVAETDHVPIISRETQEFLKMVLSDLNPEKILEIGTGVGYSAIFMAEQCPDSHITTLELIDKRIDEAKANIKEFDLDEQIEIVEGDASETLKEMTFDSLNHSKFDFIFVDSAKSRYREFFDMGMTLLSDNGVIVMDNVLLHGRTVSDKFFRKHRDKTSSLKMREFIEYVRRLDNVSCSLFGINDGVLVIRQQ